MVRINEQWQRIAAVLGDVSKESRERCVEKFYQYLRASLQLPCEVTGIEDFQWEEIYIFGPGDPVEYQELRLTQPSYKDRFELLEIEKDVDSEWMMCPHEDMGAYVRRKSDRKEFRLGLSELKAVGKDSLNKRLLDDYSIWFVNSR
jgi:hypothetical protein